MPDYQDIPQAISEFLSGGTAPPSDELADLAINYSSICNEANDRLRRCAEYLRRGLRSEAVHLAVCQPGLIELALSLVQVDRQKWDLLCASHRIRPAPRLLSDNIPELREAMSTEDGLARLLSRHRVLGLTNASAAERLRCLDAIAVKDPDNACWTGQMREIEPIRLREILAEAMAARKAMDLTAVARLVEELDARPWHTVSPKELREPLSKLVTALHSRQVKQDLTALMPNLLSSCQAQTYELCSETMRQMQAIIGREQVVLTPDVAEKIASVASWLANEERRRETTEKLKAVQPRLQAEKRALQQRLRRSLVKIAIAVTILVGLVIGTAKYFLRK